MPTYIPDEIHPLLDAYLEAIQAQLPNILQAFYLHGSIALGAFQAEWSDIDFVAILKCPLSEAEYEILNQIHRKLIITYDKYQMEGAYLLAQDLGQEKHPPRPNFHNGKLSMGNFEANEVTWWLLKYRGVQVYGELPDFAVDWDRLIAKMHANMNSYWRSFTVDPRRMLWLFTDYGIQWVVLGTLRQYYTFCENDICSKVAAGEYGLQNFPEWQRIIQEALAMRRKEKSLYQNRIRRAFDAWRFLRFIIRRSNEL